MSGTVKRASWNGILIVQVALLVLFYQWKVEGVIGAGRLFQTWMWIYVVVHIVNYFSTTKAGETILAQSSWQRRFLDCFRVLMFCLLTWFDHIALAVFYLIATICWVTYRTRFDAAGQLKVKEQSA